MYIIAIVVLFLVAWSAVGYMSSRVEQPQYQVVSRASGYEIRLYPAHIVVQTVVSGEYQQALRDGFRIVAGYVFGGNTRREKIAMTAPVTEQSGQKIAMTAPVLATIDGSSHIIAFGMPRSQTMESLPTPTDPRVSLVSIPEKKMAAIHFSWLRTAARVEAKKSELLALLKRDNVTTLREPQYAGYDAPWTPPWMTRNEVLVEVE